MRSNSMHSVGCRTGVHANELVASCGDLPVVYLASRKVPVTRRAAVREEAEFNCMRRRFGGLKPYRAAMWREIGGCLQPALWMTQEVLANRNTVKATTTSASKNLVAAWPCHLLPQITLSVHHTHVRTGQSGIPRVMRDNRHLTNCIFQVNINAWPI